MFRSDCDAMSNHSNNYNIENHDASSFHKNTIRKGWQSLLTQIIWILDANINKGVLNVFLLTSYSQKQRLIFQLCNTNFFDVCKVNFDSSDIILLKYSSQPTSHDSCLDSQLIHLYGTDDELERGISYFEENNEKLSKYLPLSINNIDDILLHEDMKSRTLASYDDLSFMTMSFISRRDLVPVSDNLTIVSALEHKILTCDDNDKEEKESSSRSTNVEITSPSKEPVVILNLNSEFHIEETLVSHNNDIGIIIDLSQCASVIKNSLKGSEEISNFVLKIQLPLLGNGPIIASNEGKTLSFRVTKNMSIYLDLAKAVRETSNGNIGLKSYFSAKQTGSLITINTNNKDFHISTLW